MPNTDFLNTPDFFTFYAQDGEGIKVNFGPLEKDKIPFNIAGEELLIDKQQAMEFGALLICLAGNDNLDYESVDELLEGFCLNRDPIREFARNVSPEM